jgi:hypothetical protein
MRFAAFIASLFLSIVSIAGDQQGPVKEDGDQGRWHFRTQFAGYQGLLSIGGGPILFRGIYMPGLMYGYAPALGARSAVHQVILRNDVVFGKSLGESTWRISPAASVNVLVEVGDHSLLRLPEYYPKNYYITPMIHGTLGAGLKARRKLDGFFKEISIHSELVALDTLLWYTISQRNAPIHKAFGLSFALCAVL